MRKHIFIPDLQVTPTTPTDHITWISKFILEKKPDVIVQAGDWADMESLSSYDYGKKAAEGRRIIQDIYSCNHSIDIFEKPISEYNEKRRAWKEKQYRPEKHITFGNHEYRIERATDSDAKIDGLVSLDDLKFEENGWKAHPFLQPVVIDGISYCHYFVNRMSGRPMGGENILLRLKNIGYSFAQGHQQMYSAGMRDLGNGNRIRGLVAGSCYLHFEDYRGAQANTEWRGILVLHEVQDGDYNLMEVSLDYLCRRYEGVGVREFLRDKYENVCPLSGWVIS